MKQSKFIVAIAIVIYAIVGNACGHSKADTPNLQTPMPAGSFELSYWIDIDLRANNGRGYWHHVADRPTDKLPTSAEIKNAVTRCRDDYHGRTLYVTYHRQFEIEDAKTVLKYWKQHAEKLGMVIVPVVVLEDYATPAALNFTEKEISDFARWCVDNINTREFGVYDIYHNRQEPKTPQDGQLAVIHGRIGNKIVRVGVQPGETLNVSVFRAVQDAWTAECQGLTNELWENPVNYKDSDNYGRKLLENWVADRVVNHGKRITWCLIPVAWDYEAPVDPYGYVCPGDDALINDPPIAGRISKCATTILKGYPEGIKKQKFGGFSCDLHILDANSAGKPESPSFYEQIKANQTYTGYFAEAMQQVATVYAQYDK